MTYPRRTEMCLYYQNPGCIRLQICGFLAAFCRDLLSYVLDLLDMLNGRVQFETRHSPQRTT